MQNYTFSLKVDLLGETASEIATSGGLESVSLHLVAAGGVVRVLQLVTGGNAVSEFGRAYSFHQKIIAFC